jgi:hypothetical protein
VKTTSFRITAEDESSLQEGTSQLIYWNVLFVDNKGSILTIRLCFDHSSFQLRPVVDELSNDSENLSLSSSSNRLFSMLTLSNNSLVSSITKYYPLRATSISEDVKLVSSQVDFLDSHRVLIGLTSGLVCVNTVLGTIASWSERNCIMGCDFTPTAATFCVPKIDSIPTTADKPSDQKQYNECAYSSFTLGRTNNQANNRVREQSTLLKSALDLLQGKSSLDIFEQRNGLQTNDSVTNIDLQHQF